jgi:hypothetical protein
MKDLHTLQRLDYQPLLIQQSEGLADLQRLDYQSLRIQQNEGLADPAEVRLSAFTNSAK